MSLPLRNRRQRRKERRSEGEDACLQCEVVGGRHGCLGQARPGGGIELAVQVQLPALAHREHLHAGAKGTAAPNFGNGQC
jgi:hypothetical protein